MRVLDPTVTDAHKAHVALETATFRCDRLQAALLALSQRLQEARAAAAAPCLVPELTPCSFGCASLTRYDALF